MVRRVPGCLHVVCAIWTLSFQTKSQVVETVENTDPVKAEEEQAILAKAPKDAGSATASNRSKGLSPEVSALPDALPRTLRTSSNLSAQSDLEVGLGNSLDQLQGFQGFQILEAQKSEMRQGLEDSKNHNLADLTDLASQNMQVLMEEIQRTCCLNMRCLYYLYNPLHMFT